MTLTIATWNINSVRLRADHLTRLCAEQRPDILCLQELKAPLDKIDLTGCTQAGYPHHVVRGQKSYNGVAIISRHPLTDLGSRDFLGRGEARHVAARLENGITIENVYVPAGGDVPDRLENPKFGDKLDFLSGLRDWSGAASPQSTILVGDLNIAPLPDDVWSHRQLLRVVSHTEIEVEALAAVMDAGGWRDVVREHIPEGKLYSWWSYRARNWDASDRGRRLDHVWATADLADKVRSASILRSMRGWDRPSDHVPVIVDFDL